jgi:hypothetical protein
MPGQVLRIIPVLVVIFLIAPAPVHPQQQIDTHSLALAEALATYRGGDLRAALARLETIPDGKLTDTVSSTSLRDAAYAGLALRGADNARTLLLLFSDGLDTSSILTESRLMTVARSDAIVYAIGVREMPRLVRGPIFTQND